MSFSKAREYPAPLRPGATTTAVLDDLGSSAPQPDSDSRTLAGSMGALVCFGLAVCAVLIHGYHLGTDDAAIWVPAIKQAADPSLYPFGGEFFLMHAHFSLFPLLLGSFARVTRLPIDDVIFLCHLLGVFLLLLASWRLLSACFERDRARWAGVALLAGVLSVPVAGTALPIMDPYVTSRSLSTPFALFAVACYLAGRWRRAIAWLAVCALIHPQMSLYAAALLALMELSKRRPWMQEQMPVLGLFLFSWLPLPWDLEPARGAARVALFSRTYFFVSNWTWYEWLGIAVPLVLLWLCTRLPLRGVRPPLVGLLHNLVRFGLFFTAAALLLVSSPHFENYTRLQPMRAFHLVYIMFFLIVGALAGEYVLKDRSWRWLALFVPLAAGMWLVGRDAFPSSRHLELPGEAEHGEWYSAFLWVRDHTPKDAVFAMDPGYLLLPGEDMHGFRAVAERSALADRVKDSGAVSLFPLLAVDWDQEVQAQTGWDHFSLRDFQKLALRYPVTWIVTRRPAAGLDCPYGTQSLAVCRILRSGR
jgi:hypothetical protein